MTLILLAGVAYLGERAVLRAREFVPLNEAALAEDEVKALTRTLVRLRDESGDTGPTSSRIIELNESYLTALWRASKIDPKNFATAYRIGEALRTESWRGETGYERLAEHAIEWFDRTLQLNPYDGYACLRRGMCLDWLKRVSEATPWFERARELDPNGYYTVAHLGWHAIYLDDYAKAYEHFNRSLKLKFHQKVDDNPIAAIYLDIVNRRLQERAREERPQINR